MLPLARYGMAGLGALLCSLCPAMAADPVESFFAGKTLRVMVGYPSGTVYDTYARMTVRHMARHIPGKPVAIIQNMPGAGGLNAIVNVANLVPRDGLTIGFSSPQNSTDVLLDPANAKYDARRVSWIGSVASETSACVFWHGKGRDLTDLRTREHVMGTTGPTSATYLEARTLETLFGFQFRYVSGYQSTVDIRLAAEKGEVDGVCGLATSTILRDMAAQLKAGDISVPIQTGVRGNPDLPGAPNVMDIVKTDEDRQVLTVVFGPLAYFRMMMAPEGVPADRLKALREAFDTTMKDPAFLAEMAQGRLDVRPLDGAAVAAQIDEIYRTPAPVVERTRKILGLAP